MELFKRLIVSLFPDTLLAQNPMNPAGMFISFINARQFFSVVNRRIIEHYKLNFFDIALDPFEIKIGFGEGMNIKPRDIEQYFAYCSVANMNGAKFYNPVFMATVMVLVIASRLRPLFEGYSYQYFYHFLLSIHHLSLFISSKIKQFPNASKEQQYQWFVDVLFSTYDRQLSQGYKSYSRDKCAQIKKELVKQLDSMFMLFYRYQHCSKSVLVGQAPLSEFYQWLLQDELQRQSSKHLIQQWLETTDTSVYRTDYSAYEKEVCQILIPTDLQIKYLLQGKEIFEVTRIILGDLYQTSEINEYLYSFLESGERFDDFLRHVTDFVGIKSRFFIGMKKYLNQTLKQYQQEQDDDADESMSFIGSFEEIEQLIPQSIKEEGKSLEKIMNFYVTFVGGMWVSRGDGGYLRLFHPELLSELQSKLTMLGGNKEDALYYYGSQLYAYSKNLFYYRHTHDHIRSGKEQFVVPARSDIKEIQSNLFVLSMFDQYALAVALQEIHPRDAKLYIKQKQILTLFKSKVSKVLASMINTTNQYEYLKALYQHIQQHLSELPDLAATLHKHLNDKDIATSKEALYTIDYRMVSDLLGYLKDHQGVYLGDLHTDLTVASIIGTLKDTILGLVLLYQYIGQLEQKHQISFRRHLLIQSVVSDLYNIKTPIDTAFMNACMYVIQSYEEIMIKWIKIDDNKGFLDIGGEQWISFIDGKSDQAVLTDIIGEDMMRLRGYLKNISYYNKRYLIPNNS